MSYLRRAFICLFVFLVATCWGQDNLDSKAEYAKLTIALTSTQGKALGKVLVILRRNRSSIDYRRSSGQGTISFEQLPFDLYEIEVQASGFSKRTERVGVYQPNMYLTIGLFPSPVHPAERSEILGLITHSAQSLWVRLVPLYSSDFIEDRVSPSGEFRLGGLFPGRFVLLVFAEDTLVKSEIVDYIGGKQRVSLTIPEHR